MSFVSYAQNREDVLLWRVLGHVRKGFYVDVGANHPSDDSVTKALYDRGWHGINIEPLPAHLAELQLHRIRDINLGVAVGDYVGSIDLFDTPVRGLATACAEVAEGLKRRGLKVTRTTVPVCRLKDILQEHQPAQIHLLKIDVEGFEAAVLRGMDFQRWRPWIVVVEATRPNSQVTDNSWEALITTHGYVRAQFDGLNRYYLAHEQASLIERLAVPANVLDNYVPVEQIRLKQVTNYKSALIDRLSEQLQNSRQVERRLEEQLASAQANLADFQVNLAAVQANLAAIQNSASWRITAPLRRLRAAFKSLAAPVTSCQVERTLGQAPEQAHKPAPECPASVATVLDCSDPVRWHLNSLASQCEAPLPVPGPPLPETSFWRVLGHVEGHYSLAAVNRGLALALANALPQRVSWQAWNGEPYSAGNNLPNSQAQGITALLNARLPDLAGPVVSLVHHYPLVADPNKADLRLALFFWEESRVPPAMVQHLDQHTDGLLVASQFVRQVLRHSGYARPVFVIPMGLDDHLLDRPVRQALNRPAASEPLIFLHVSSAFDRKGVDLLLEAYFKWFSEQDAVRLVIKTFPNPHNQVAKLLAQWRERYPQGPAVELLEETLDEAGLERLYDQAHAMVLPTRGEGFNLPAAEALARGLPLIVTGQGGQADFASHQTAHLLPYRVTKSRSHLTSGCSHWLEPDAQALGQRMAQLRTQILASDPALLDTCQDAAQWMRQHYRWSLSADATQAAAAWIWHHKSEPPPPHPRLCVLSPWATACGVAAYAQSLLQGWESAFDVDVMCDTRTPVDPRQTHYSPRWSLGDSAGVQTLLESLLARDASLRPHVLLVQHQQSLFLLTDGVCRALSQLEQAGVIVVLELHSTLPMVRDNRISDLAAAQLERLSLIVVHQLEDVNQLMGLGITRQVMNLPLGVTPLSEDSPLRQRSELGLQEADLVLGCFGFLMPHKGVDVVIASMPELARQTGRRVRLLAVTAALDDRAVHTLLACRQLAQDLGVAQDIVWITDFRPIEDSLNLLRLADLQLFVYGDTQESASAAVTVGLATGRPVLVSPSPIFNEVKACTYGLASATPKAVVQGVLNLLSQSHLANDLSRAQRQWMNEHSWTVVSSRLKACVQGLMFDRRTKVTAHMPHKVQVRQLLVDVSELVFRDGGTGIQRVVHKILLNWIAKTPAGFVVRPVFATHGEAYRYTDRWQTNDAEVSKLRDQRVTVSAGDIFVGLDLSAHLFPGVEGQLKSWRMAGVRVNFVVYDIIPLLEPYVAGPGLHAAFLEWMKVLQRQSDRLVCISAVVAEDVRKWMHCNAAPGTLPDVAHFHLGGDGLSLMDQRPLDPETEVAPWVPDAQGTSILMVGTVEPRKGHGQALAAIELLWKKGLDLQLVVAGKPGWNVDALCERMRSHPECGRRLHWLDRADDVQIQALYRSCHALLAASTAEGFGLPLVEAAHSKLPIIARDIPVFHEVAGVHAFYFSGHEPEDLARALENWLALKTKNQIPSTDGMPVITWEASALQLLEAVL